MNHKERTVVVAVLFIVAILVTFDVITDLKEGVVAWHLVIEAGTGLSALFGTFFLMKDSFKTKHQLSNSLNENIKLKKEASEWKAETQKFIQGLSQSIDVQLSKWNLTVSEKEVALLLLKGLSLKEIADIRKTSEKTARAHSIAIYSKSGLAGRSELAAFFLEDLLHPQELNNDLNRF